MVWHFRSRSLTPSKPRAWKFCSLKTDLQFWKLSQHRIWAFPKNFWFISCIKNIRPCPYPLLPSWQCISNKASDNTNMLKLMASFLGVREADPPQGCGGSHRCYFSMGITGPTEMSPAQQQNCCPAHWWVIDYCRQSSWGFCNFPCQLCYRHFRSYYIFKQPCDLLLGYTKMAEVVFSYEDQLIKYILQKKIKK